MHLPGKGGPVGAEDGDASLTVAGSLAARLENPGDFITWIDGVAGHSR